MKGRAKFIDILIYIILIGMSISPAFALGAGNRNLLLIGIMGLMPLVIIRYMEFDKRSLLLVLFMLVLIISPLLNHPETMRWSTVMYSCLFCFTFIAYTQLLRHSNFSSEAFLKFLKYTIFAYTIILLIQQFCVLTKLPILNLSNYDHTNPWKLNSLMSEPAHSARVVPTLMYCYIYIKELRQGARYSPGNILHTDRLLWLCFLWTMLTMVSASAYVFLLIVLSKFLSFRWLFSSIAIVSLLFMTAYLFEFKPAVRAKQTLFATLTFDENIVMQTDGSASARIVPTMKLIKTVSIFSIDGLFGHGIDQVANDKVIDMSSIGYGKKGVAGGLMTLWYDNGFIAFILFTVFSMGCCVNKKDALITFLLWITMVYIFGVNNQMVWLTIILLYTNKMLTKRVEEK